MKRVIVTGIQGFLGQHLKGVLEANDTKVIGIKHSGLTGPDGHQCDLTERSETIRMFERIAYWGDIHVVYHLAGEVGGLGHNLTTPMDLFIKNSQIGLNVLEACQKVRVGKVVSVVASCAYPDKQTHKVMNQSTNAFFPYVNVIGERETCPEDEFFNGPPHESVSCHGYAKRNLQLASSYAAKQHGLKAVCVCPTTLYGPGEKFDERSKIVGAMVKRFVDAVDSGANQVAVWGTGRPLREFLYVQDCAQLLVKAAAGYDDSSMPLNLGTGQELSIEQLAEKVAGLTGFQGQILFDSSKPDGQYRKRLDLTRMRKYLGEFEPTSLNEGILKTIAYYRKIKPSGA